MAEHCMELESEKVACREPLAAKSAERDSTRQETSSGAREFDDEFARRSERRRTEPNVTGTSAATELTPRKRHLSKPFAITMERCKDHQRHIGFLEAWRRASSSVETIQITQCKRTCRMNRSQISPRDAHRRIGNRSAPSNSTYPARCAEIPCESGRSSPTLSSNAIKFYDAEPSNRAGESRGARWVAAPSRSR